MNNSDIDTASDILDSGWLRFWIVFSCVCLIISIFLPDVQMLKNRYILIWFWESQAINSPGSHGALWVYLLLAMSLIMLVCRSMVEGKYLAAMGVLTMTLVTFVLLTSGHSPKTAGMWSQLNPLWMVLFLCASGLVLCGVHLYKVFAGRHFPKVLLIAGGVLLVAILFIKQGETHGQGLLLSLMNSTAWITESLIGSISVIIIVLVALLALLSFKLDTCRVLSIFLRVVFLGIPALVFFYLYLPVSSKAGFSMATISFEAAQQTLWIYGFLMYPAAVASLIEWNTTTD